MTTGLRGRWLTLAAMGLLIASCDSLPTAPFKFARDAGLEISLTISSDHGDPAHPITIDVRVVNAGRIPVYYGVDCVQPSLHLDVHDPDRANISIPCIECPGMPCPLCPAHVAPLRSRESIEQTITFGGTLLNCAGFYQGRAGVYEVDAILYARTADGRDMTVSRATSFTWSTPAPR